ncbi:hypothetical protein O6H91_08G107800 [Diphasiastrum complanatum]|nr:hypothetical protein O6H91_08G107800 [Diphasiastrum complanatum]
MNGGDEVTDKVQDGSVDLRGRPVSRAKSGGWKACLFIFGVEFCERLTYYGVGGNLVTYLALSLHEGLEASVKNVNNWLGVTFVTPLLGAFLADAYWGRYWTIGSFGGVYLIGLIVLTISASVPSLRPPPCLDPSNCQKANPSQLGCFFFGLYLISIATGGVKPCLQAFGGDQLDEEDPTERRHKTSFFNWWYFSLNLGAILAFTVLVSIQDTGSWGWGFGIPALSMAMALIFFFAGTPTYRHKLPGGSVATRIAQVLVAAFRKRHLAFPADVLMLHETYDEKANMQYGRRKLLHASQFRFLDMAAVYESLDHKDVNGLDSKKHESPWRLCTVTQVEEVKLILRLLPVCLCCLTYSVIGAQVATFFTKQGNTMDRRMGRVKIPPASLQTFVVGTSLLFIPIYDRIFVPVARRFTGNVRGISILQRLGTGFCLGMLAMAAASATEAKRLRVAKEHGLLDKPTSTIPLTIFWLIPQYALLGISHDCSVVALQELCYDQMPDTQRSMGVAIFLCTVALGNFLTNLIITIVNKATDGGKHGAWINDNINRSHLDYFYCLLAILGVINQIIFVFVARWYSYKKPESVEETKLREQTLPKTTAIVA